MGGRGGEGGGRADAGRIPVPALILFSPCARPAGAQLAPAKRIRHPCRPPDLPAGPAPEAPEKLRRLLVHGHNSIRLGSAPPAAACRRRHPSPPPPPASRVARRLPGRPQEGAGRGGARQSARIGRAAHAAGAACRVAGAVRCAQCARRAGRRRAAALGGSERPACDEPVRRGVFVEDDNDVLGLCA